MYMKYTKEQVLAVILYNIAAADGNVTTEERDQISELASSLKDFDTNGIKNAFANTEIIKLPIGEIVDSINPEDKSKYIYACCNIVTSDKLVSFSELICLHKIAEMLEIPAYLVSYYMAKVIQEYPEISFED